MADDSQTLLEQLQARFGGALLEYRLDRSQATVVAPASGALEAFAVLRDEFAFEQLMDLCGVDYSAYGEAEWATTASSSTGFSRGVSERATGRSSAAICYLGDKALAHRGRFAVVYHLLSISRNQRLRVRVFAPDDELPVVASVCSLWAAADWYEREAFDLYGILFEGHPDLRRLLTDYGFVGHPFRKDFPLIGNVEMRYDPERGRVVYEPVSIEPRVLVPRTIRQDHRYAGETPREGSSHA